MSRPLPFIPRAVPGTPAPPRSCCTWARRCPGGRAVAQTAASGPPRRLPCVRWVQHVPFNRRSQMHSQIVHAGVAHHPHLPARAVHMRPIPGCPPSLHAVNHRHSSAAVDAPIAPRSSASSPPGSRDSNSCTRDCGNNHGSRYVSALRPTGSPRTMTRRGDAPTPPLPSPAPPGLRAGQTGPAPRAPRCAWGGCPRSCRCCERSREASLGHGTWNPLTSPPSSCNTQRHPSPHPCALLSCSCRASSATTVGPASPPRGPTPAASPAVASIAAPWWAATSTRI